MPNTMPRSACLCLRTFFGGPTDSCPGPLSVLRLCERCREYRRERLQQKEMNSSANAALGVVTRRRSTSPNPQQEPLAASEHSAPARTAFQGRFVRFFVAQCCAIIGHPRGTLFCRTWLCGTGVFLQYRTDRASYTVFGDMLGALVLLLAVLV